MAAMPPDDSFVEVTFRLPENELRALEQLATGLGVPPDEALRKALATEVFIQGLLAEGTAISYRTADGIAGEITF